MFKSFFKLYSLVLLIFWLSAFVLLQDQMAIFYMVFVAFLLGLRHGFDADHIVAIDNVTRQLAIDKKYHMTTGTFFALGHSSIVVIMTVLLISGISIFQNESSVVMQSGAYIGSFASTIFLWLMVLINGLFIIKTLKNTKLDHHNHFLSKLAKPLLKSINKPYKMYFVGFIFGLGFDTATEIALLGLAASSYIHGNSISIILLLPLAFALGMALVDSLSAGIMAKLVLLANNNQSYYRRYQLTISSVALVISALLGLFQTFELFNIKISSIMVHLSIFVSEYSEFIGGSVVAIVLVFLGYLLLKNRQAKFIALGD
ncbi:metal transporter [Thiotrichales bacterium 19S11-10]|nr:metal transporter [Thiotrichales bacterium 19S11-10]